MNANKKYTAIIRKSKFEYVAVCLELNVSARGKDIAEVEGNLRAAIELYIDDLKEHPETLVSSMSAEELIEFLQDTESDRYSALSADFVLRPFELNEVPSYV
ncbi:MAG TPA: type II toxin-antitoxin system HicB family antitoxin [Thermodesulfovibrionia bacterium]|nr:type II toxin-antitoxin system HicB family antitoxin [Thermodesulfovibrionia bacterium]